MGEESKIDMKQIFAIFKKDGLSKLSTEEF